MRVKVHVKNNRARPGGFPPTPEAEPVFTTTRERFDAVLSEFPDLADKIDVFIDWDVDNFRTSMREASVLLTWDLPTENIAAVAPELKWIHIIGAGVEHLCPMNWVPDGVTVTNNKGAQAEKAGEFGVMAVLMLNCKIPAIASNQRKAQWESLFSTPVSGKTVLIAGVGHLGGSAANRLREMGLKVLGINRSGRAHDGVDEMGTWSDLEAFLPRADFLLVALPATPLTGNLLDRDRLALLKDGAGVINIGRAATMDYDALCDMLRNGQLSGAILDVFEPEPLPAASPLWETPNLLILPHVSSDDGDTYVETTLRIFLANMRRFLAGNQLENRVRPELGY